jgi:hypothetical protein
MSEKGIDAYRVASVLGYCLLPMVGVGALSVMVVLEFVSLFAMLIRPYLLLLSAASQVICSRSSPSFGVHMQPQASLLLSSVCRTSDCSLPIPLASSTVALHFSVCSV